MGTSQRVVVTIFMMVFFVVLAQNEPVHILGAHGEKPVDLSNLPFTFLGLITLWLAFGATLRVQKAESIEELAEIDRSDIGRLAFEWLKVWLVFLSITLGAGLVAASLGWSYTVASYLALGGFVAQYVAINARSWAKSLWN